MAGEIAPNATAGTSIFDPVLCEVVYRWFCHRGGVVLDPFAGGSVRGIVAALCGREYVGIELRAEQIKANEEQARRICGDVVPAWVEGDARNAAQIAHGEYDLVFSCPPYYDLEVYSDDPRDLSSMPDGEFDAAYRDVVAACVAMLRDNRFACFVVGNVRRPNGTYRDLVGLTVDAFESAGAALYNEAVLVTALGSLPVRTGRQFAASRKFGRAHQNVLTFVKGDGAEAAGAAGEIAIEDVDHAIAAARGVAVPMDDEAEDDAA